MSICGSECGRPCLGLAFPTTIEGLINHSVRPLLLLKVNETSEAFHGLSVHG